MTLPIFPLDRQPILAGQQQSLEDNVLRSQNDTGPPELRRISTQLRETHSLVYIVTDCEKDILVDWFRNDIAQGAKSFEILIGCTSYRAQLTGVIGFTPVGAGGWRLTFNILTLGEL